MTKRRSTQKPAAPVVQPSQMDDLKQPEPTIELGDHVYVGEPADGKVHWEVDYLPQVAVDNPGYPAVRLVSGMTGRMRMAAYADLRLHSKGEAAG